jgi:uncharacterized protein
MVVPRRNRRSDSPALLSASELICLRKKTPAKEIPPKSKLNSSSCSAPAYHLAAYSRADMDLSALSKEKYVSLVTFRKTEAAVTTPVWFAEDSGKLYVMTRSDSGKYKRIRNNPKVRVAACTMRGKVTGPELNATARILPADDWPRAARLIRKKYWLARVPFFWSKLNVYLEVTLA